MSGQRGYNPYAPPNQQPPESDEFAATSYDQFAQPETPTTPTGYDQPQHSSSAYQPLSSSYTDAAPARPQQSYQSSQPTSSSVYEQPSRDQYGVHDQLGSQLGAHDQLNTQPGTHNDLNTHSEYNEHNSQDPYSSQDPYHQSGSQYGQSYDQYGQPYEQYSQPAAYEPPPTRQQAEADHLQAQQQQLQQKQAQQQQQLQQQQLQQQQKQQQHAVPANKETYEMQDQSNLQFFNEVDDIKRNLVQYEDNIERIEGLHKRSLAESNLENEAAVQKQLDTLQADTRGLAENLKTRIKRLEATSQRDSTKSAQAQNLKHQFMTMIQKFQATEAAFRQRYRDVAARQYRIVDPEASEQQIQQAIDEDPGANQVFSQALMQSNRRGEARSALTEVQIRHREIQKIEATISELAQLFHDMEVMVAEQDQQVTHVEQNVYGAQNDIERGVDNQFSAIKKARAWRKKKWWCVALIVIVVLFCILFFAIYFGGGYNH